MKNLLPIGSVVLLEGGEKRLMIIGMIQINPDDGKQYDYLACLYPEGFVGFEYTYLFNHKDIEKTYSQGFIDEEFYAFHEKLAELFGDQEDMDPD